MAGESTKPRTTDEEYQATLRANEARLTRENVEIALAYDALPTAGQKIDRLREAIKLLDRQVGCVLPEGYV